MNLKYRTTLLSVHRTFNLKSKKKLWRKLSQTHEKRKTKQKLKKKKQNNGAKKK